jgi:hypothetical protein
MLSYALPDEAAKAFRKEHQNDEIVYEAVLNNFIARIRDYIMWDAEKSVIPISAAAISHAVAQTIFDGIDAVVTDKAHAADYRFSSFQVITVD